MLTHSRQIPPLPKKNTQKRRINSVNLKHIKVIFSYRVDDLPDWSDEIPLDSIRKKRSGSDSCTSRSARWNRDDVHTYWVAVSLKDIGTIFSIYSL